MIVTTAERVRRWSGPALLSFGFRPFFLLGPIYAAATMAIWVPWYLGFISVPTLFPPVAWHAHELLFGYVPAIVAGFLLTAVPNWTGRLPVVGWPLAGLALLWLFGRAAVAVSDKLGPGLTALTTLSFLAALGLVIGREIVAGRNWRNLKVLAILTILLAAQALFQWEIWRYGRSTYGADIAVAAIIVLIMLIGGRIVPSFTGNWLRRRGVDRLPASFSTFDTLAVGASVAALTLWVARPALSGGDGVIGAMLFLAAVVQFIRQARWRPQHTVSEPIVLILHLAYFFVPVGFVLAGLSLLVDGLAQSSAAIHAWTAGTIGTMTLAVMTRATLGHTGRPIHAGWMTTAIYACVIAAAVARIIVALDPAWTMVLMPLAGLTWVGAFAGFAAVYGPMLMTPRR